MEDHHGNSITKHNEHHENTSDFDNNIDVEN